MACERYRDALSDVAAGGPGPAGLEAHLASCEACRLELGALRRALADIDAELEGLLVAEPSPDLAERIRQAVAASEVARPARFGWLWPAAAVAAVLAVALAAWLAREPGPGVPVVSDARMQRPDVPPPAPGPAGEASPPGGPLARASKARPLAPSLRLAGAPAPRRPPGTASQVAAGPEVLVPPGEGEALLRLVALVHRERLAPPALAAAGQPSAEPGEPELLSIEALEIVPLDPAEVS